MASFGSQTVNGISLEQFAGVSAAQMEGFSLPDALANDGIAPAIWSRASVGWNRKLASAGVEAPLGLAFRALLGRAQDWLGGRVLPVDDDPAAWLDLLAALASQPDPTTLLAQLGVKAREVARCQRRWAGRIAEDETIRKRVAALASEKRQPVPTITVVAPVLRPFPWSRALRPPDVTPAPALPTGARDPVLPLDHYAALKAELCVRPADRERILLRYGLDEPGLERVEAGWRLRFEAEPTAARDFRLLESLSRVRFQAEGAKGGFTARGASPMVSSIRPVVGPPKGSRDVGIAVADTVDGPGSALAPSSVTPPQTDAPGRPPGSSALAAGTVAPGASRSVEAEGGTGARLASAPPAKKPMQQSPLAATAEVSLEVLGLAPLPFGAGRAASRSPEAEAKRGMHAAGGAAPPSSTASHELPSSIHGTAELTPEMLAALRRRVHAPPFVADMTGAPLGGGRLRDGAAPDAPQGTAQNVSAGPSSQTVAAPADAAPTPARAGSGGEPGQQSLPAGTAEVSLAALAASPLPFTSGQTPVEGSSAREAQGVAVAATPPQDSPTAGETREVSVTEVRAGLEAIPFGSKPSATTQAPALTLEQYASLRAELEVAPGEVERIERSYGIASAAERDALRVAWAVELATKPAQMKRFEELRKSFVAWLLEQKR